MDIGHACDAAPAGAFNRLTSNPAFNFARARCMLTLRTGNTSPFGRKARIAIALLGLQNAVRVEPASTQDPVDPIQTQNPLGKGPVLVLEDGTALYDSPVILEYLDHLAGGGRIIPSAPAPRFAALRLQALADGIMDASILISYEGPYRPAGRPG